ncbi:transcriptional protein SWT1 [Monomorium pharaonis]|uniref:transcriptional protein SWT1 n=1 Tax=Monomorium pharaonis TaxID=307658 RepID=UPI00063EE8E1|nr:transcriptional protein SWT1 [Monomorium pharaonis]
MLKHKLPKDWIIVSSKSHPDRVYYFNVKTNQSSWSVPTLNEADKNFIETSSPKKHKIDEKGKREAMTSKHNVEKEDTSYQRRLDNKTIETPQMKTVREKVLQRSSPRNKSSSISDTLDTSSLSVIDKRKISSPKDSASRLRNDKSVTAWDKNDNKVTFTPQMRVLYDKIEQRNLKKSNQNKILKEDLKKQQNLNATDQKLKIQEKKMEHRESIVQNKQHNKNQNVLKWKKEKVVFKKNLAKERMEKIRKNLNCNEEKIKEICQTDLVSKKSPQKTNGRLPNLSNTLGSTRVYRNVDVRLKKLHNRILKNAVYEKNATLNNDKSQQNQQSNESVVENMTNEKLIEQAKQEVLYEEMDWEPMKDEEIALEVEVVRTQIGRENPVGDTNCIPENTAELTHPNEIELQEKCPLYIVVDTNVFLSNLEIVGEARDVTFKNYPRPFIVIPWTVIRELDYIKDNKSKYELSIKARKAISFIHNQFSSKHPRVIGQTREQAEKNKEQFSLDCPDDEILQCCLQIHQLKKSVVLLSFDKNLCTKAMIYNIRALGRNDPLEKIDNVDWDNTVDNYLNKDRPVEHSIFNEELRLSDDIFEDTKSIMKNFLSTIIMKQMSEIYGEVEWEVYVKIKPPWTIVTALKCAIKHWIAAINESFQRCAEHILKELLNAFLSVGGRKFQDVEYILEKCSDLVQLVNMDKHCDLMTHTFNTITELKKKCTKYTTDMEHKKLHEKIGMAENVQEQEMRAEKVFECFQHIFNYARNFCALACSNAGIACPYTFESNLSLSPAYIQLMQSEITRKMTDLTQNLNKLLVQAENSLKYQALLTLQQNLNTFMPDTERVTFDVTPLDVYYCVKLKEELLKAGLKQLQDLTSYFCGLATRI